MSVTSPTIQSRFAGLLGAGGVISDPTAVAAFQIDGIVPSVVVRPDAVEQIPEIIKLAAAEKLAVVVTGGRTKLNVGLPPAKYDVALDMSALNKIIAYDPGDLTLSVEAGIPLRQISRALAQHGQFLRSQFPSLSAPPSAAPSPPASTGRCASFTEPRAIICSAWNSSPAKESPRRAEVAW